MLAKVLQREFPIWALVLALAALVALLVFIWWRSFIAGAQPGPPKAVRPGMYDLRQEIQKARAREASAGVPRGK